MRAETRDADHAQRSAASLAVVQAMEAALGANADNMADYFHDDFRWMGNQGCGTKHGLEAFRSNWQLPLRAAFTERTYHTERFLADGDYVSCHGHIEATHTGTFMGLAPTGQRVTIPYMDFWEVRDGRIADNWVSVDFAAVLAQLGRDVFDGHGWEAFDDGRRTPPTPE
ncbi:MAG: ester cyclase [Pseudomonadota bacterium]